MAVHNGILLNGPFGAGFPDGSPTEIADILLDPYPDVPVLGGEYMVSANPGSGSHADGDRPWYANYDSVFAPSFKDFWYYRIHLTPSVFNLGPVLSAAQLEFVLWNAYIDETVTCTAISETGLNGITLNGLAAPFTLWKLGYAPYTVDVAATGGSIIDCQLAWNLGTKGIYTVYITGNRLTIFQWRPQEPIEETLEPATEILESRNGSLQRISNRAEPRQRFSFNVKLDGLRERNRYDSKMFRWQKKAFALPIWTELVEHTEDVNKGVSNIALDTAYADFRVDGLAVIWQSPTKYEIISINAVNPGSLDLTSPVVDTYTGYKEIMPARICNCIGAMKKDVQRNGDWSTAKMTFQVIQNILLTGYTPMMTYDGYTVITVPTTIDTAVQHTTDGQLVITDFVTGGFRAYSPKLYNRVTQQHIFVNEGKQACWNFRLFLHSLRGMQKAFLVPSFLEDMSVVGTFGPTDTVMAVQNCNFYEDMGFQPFKEYLAFINRSTGAVDAVRRITGIAETDENSEDVSIDAQTGLTITNATHVVSFAPKCTLAKDDVTLVWDRCHRNECKVDLTHVEV